MHRGGRGGGHREGSASYRPPYRFNTTVPVDIPFTGDGFHLRKRCVYIECIYVCMRI